MKYNTYFQDVFLIYPHWVDGEAKAKANYTELILKAVWARQYFVYGGIIKNRNDNLPLSLLDIFSCNIFDPELPRGEG